MAAEPVEEPLGFVQALLETSDSSDSESSSGKSAQDLSIQNIQRESWWHLQGIGESDLVLRRNKVLRSCGGAIGGVSCGILPSITSVNTWMHEYLGHCLLGFRLLYSYPEGGGPKYVVSAWKAFEEGGIKGWIDWVFHNNGVAGYAWGGTRTVNPLGEYLGRQKRSAWVSLSGSVPALCVSSAVVSGGVAIRDKVPVVGDFLIGFGLFEHLASSIYPWSAAVMSSEDLVSKARVGHDFANFAVQVSKITPFSARAIAIATASLWTVSVPFLALGIYLFKKSKEKDLISDRIALQYWITQSLKDKQKEALFAKLYKEYPEKRPDFRFFEYLLDKLPKEELQKAKEEIMHYWAKAKPQDKLQTAVDSVSIVFGVVSTVISVAAKVFEVLGETILPKLAPAASVCNYAAPLLGAVTLLSEIYEAQKDLNTPSEQMPQLAKVLTVAKLVVAVVGSTLLVVGAFIPGINAFVICGFVLGTGGTIAFALAKQVVIKKRIRLYHAINPVQCDMMIAFLNKRKDNSSINQKVANWIKNVRSANEKGLLKSSSLRNKLRKVPGLENL
jgi:hypothetical protein